MYPPPKKKTQNQHQAKGNTPIKIFSLTTIRVLSNGSQAIEKNTTIQTKKYCTMASRRGLAVKTFVSAVSTGVILKTSLQTFMFKV